jgi:predicted MFS family arabinose efflux permease
MQSPRATGATLLLCLGASQAAILVLSPVLAEVAVELDVSTATAGQLRTVSGLAAGATALLVGLLAARVGVRELVASGLGLITLGAAASAAAPGFSSLAAAQALVGMGVGLSYAAGVAAVAEWSTPETRSQVLAVALLGPPLAWVVGMPLVGLLGDISWRLAWIGVPFAASIVALGFLSRRASTPPAPRRAGMRAVVSAPGVLRWSIGELFAFSGWAGSLVFVGALFVESYGLSISATGLALGFGALVYVPGNLLFRRRVDDHGHLLLIVLPLAAAAAVAVLGAVRPSAWFSLATFCALCFVAGGRTLAGSARGLDLAPELRLGVTGVRAAAIQLGYFVGAAVGGVALAAGGYGTLGLAFAVLFVAAAIPHVRAVRAHGPSPPLR